MILTLKDGGKLIIKDSQLQAWNNIYKVDSKPIIESLDKQGTFTTCSKNKTLKTINRALQEAKAS